MIFGGMLSLRRARFDSGDAFCIWLVALDDFTLFSLGMAFDKQFARRLELAEELAGAAVARAHRETVTDSHAEIFSVAGGSAIFVEPGSPISQCIGCGVLQPVTENEIEQIEQFYFSRGHGSQIALSRVFAREFEFALASHGYQIAEQNLAFYLELPWRNTPQVPDGYEIREIAWQERERWAEMQSNSFFDDPLQAEAFVSCSCLSRARKVIVAMSQLIGPPVNSPQAARFLFRRNTASRALQEQQRVPNIGGADCRRRCCSGGWRMQPLPVAISHS